MNKISFKGSTGIIKDFAARFLCVNDTLAMPGGRMSIKYERALHRIADERSLEVGILERVIDFLDKHGVPETRIKQLIEEKVDDLAGLAEDVAILKRNIENGTIIDVEVVDEWPF